MHQKWLFSASEDGSVKIWDRRSGVCQRDKTIRDKKTFVNCAVLHPNQGEIVCFLTVPFSKNFEIFTDFQVLHGFSENV